MELGLSEGCPAESANHRLTPVDARLGSLVSGKYKLLRKLAIGGMGIVYEAEHIVVGRRFAVKFLHEQFTGQRNMVRRFVREARVAGSLQSDHIIGALDYGVFEGLPYLVMDLHRGEDLRAMLQQEKRLPVERAVCLGIDICRGLDVAHRAGLVHRDLKPANLFVAQRCNGGELVKILDFGVAKLRGAQDLSDEGAMVGTLGYMAPEQILGSSTLDGRADLYSLGVVLYEALAGRLPYRGDRSELLFEVLSGKPNNLAQLRPDLPEGLTQAIHQCLQKDPDARPACARQLAQLLSPYAGRKSIAERACSLSRETHEAVPSLDVETPLENPTLHSSQPVAAEVARAETIRAPEPQPSKKSALADNVTLAGPNRLALIASVGALVLSLVAVTTMFVFVYSHGARAINPAQEAPRTAQGNPAPPPTQVPSASSALMTLVSEAESLSLGRELEKVKQKTRAAHSLQNALQRRTFVD